MIAEHAVRARLMMDGARRECGLVMGRAAVVTEPRLDRDWLAWVRSSGAATCVTVSASLKFTDGCADVAVC